MTPPVAVSRGYNREEYAKLCSGNIIPDWRSRKLRIAVYMKGMSVCIEYCKERPTRHSRRAKRPRKASASLVM
jgi:hypothetical protein